MLTVIMPNYIVVEIPTALSVTTAIGIVSHDAINRALSAIGDDLTKIIMRYYPSVGFYIRSMILEFTNYGSNTWVLRNAICGIIQSCKGI
ncbi:hypothetical protein [Mahella australiensis]|uniref:hypothetical protein n=1 Tax=Mahella australiensis TaxID=252966 RepID=UPI00149464E6|nr:hypothetical protein [Mahella australiensis]